MACISAPPLVHPILLMGKVVQLGAYAEAEGQPPEDHCRHDPFFLPPGAEAFKRDNPNAVVRFFDTGHFALETHAREIAESIRDFLK